VIEACVRVWKESSRSLSDICGERGIVYINALQPTLHDPGSKPLTPSEIQHGSMPESWIQGAALGYPLLRARGEELRRAGVDFIDASRLFENHPEELYYDACHFVNAGHALLAQEIGAELLRRLRERK
jgi:hypothetical protein